MGRRALGWALLAYGVAGIALVVFGAVAGMQMAAGFERLTVTADSTLAAAARATDATADSFANVDESLSDAQASATGAAALAREASASLDSLALAMQLTILGAQPLQPLAAEFATSSEQASALAGTLDEVGTSLGDTRTDVSRVGAELEQLAAELRALREASVQGNDSPPVRLFVVMLIAWLALPAIGALVAGALLLRPPSVRQPGPAA